MARFQLELHVEMEDGSTFDVVADQRDIARWEVQDFGCPFADAVERQLLMAFRYFAWSAASRRGLLPEVDGKPMTWEQFDVLCVEASDPIDDDEDAVIEVTDPDPGQPAPSEGTSSTSLGAPGSH